MVITWQSGQDFLLKIKNISVKIGSQIKLGDLDITGPGEYESQGIQLENHDGVIQVYGEGLNIGHIKKAKVMGDDELSRVNGIDILLIGVGGGDYTDNKTAFAVINQIEPSLVIPMFEGNVEEFAKEEGANLEGLDELKVVKSELSPDERRTFILKAKK